MSDLSVKKRSNTQMSSGNVSNSNVSRDSSISHTHNNQLLTQASDDDSAMSFGDSDMSLQDLIDAELNSRLVTSTVTETTDLYSSETLTSGYSMLSNTEKSYSDVEETRLSESNVAVDQVCERLQHQNIYSQSIANQKSSNSGEIDVHIENSDVNSERSNETTQPSTHDSATPDSSARLPNLTIDISTSQHSDSEKSSIKEKLLLGSDEQMCLLFSQTITSPAYTPTEEHIDFLSALKREENSVEEFERIEKIVINGKDKMDRIEENTQNGRKRSSSEDISSENEREYSSEDETDCMISTIKVQEKEGFEEESIKIPAQISCDSTPSDEALVEYNPETPDDTRREFVYDLNHDANRRESMTSNHVETFSDLEMTIDSQVSIGDLLSDHEILKSDNFEVVEKRFSQIYSDLDGTGDGGITEPEQSRPDCDGLKLESYSDPSPHSGIPIIIHSQICDETSESTTCTIPASPQLCEEIKQRTSSTPNVAEIGKEADDDAKPEIVISLDDESFDGRFESFDGDNCGDNVSDSGKKPLIDSARLSRVRENQFLLNDRKVRSGSSSNTSSPAVSPTHKMSMGYGSNSTIEMTSNSTTKTSSIKTSSVEQIDDVEMVEKTQVKKKKTKKVKKDHEKENISVMDKRLYYEDELSRVNVKTLRAKSMVDLRKLDNQMDRFYTGVSVKSLKQSFSKFDALAKKTVLHVRSSDAGKAQEKFNGNAQLEQVCRSCNKQVFQMEQIKAEKSIWHRNCFRCKECNKNLNVDTYQSHEGELFCKPHFKQLFAPKVVEDSKPQKPQKHELIIRENQPVELPPDVVRASDKPDLGLEELQSLNMKERFQVFEHANNQDDPHTLIDRSNSTIKRSSSILSKLARFQAKGMDVGVSDDLLNGIPIEQSSESEADEEDDGIDGEDADLIRAKRKMAQKEIPVVFDKLNDLKSKWEQGNHKEERREERKQELQTIRSRLFMGKQGKMKEMYQQAVAESETNVSKKLNLDTEVCEKTKSIKERFEKGEVLTPKADDEAKTIIDEDSSVFDAAISKKSRSIFQELDAHAGKAPAMVPLTTTKSQSDVKKLRESFTRNVSEDIVKCTDTVDDIEIRTAEISNKFKFFETYKEPEKKRRQFRITPPRDGVVKDNSPDREVYRDPEVVRAEEKVEDVVLAQQTHTAKKMLSIFRQMEEQQTQEPVQVGPKPLKRFTPPPEPSKEESESEGEDVTDNESEEEEVDARQPHVNDPHLIEAQKAARAQQLRAKFERWEENEIKRDQNNSAVNLVRDDDNTDEQIESARSLRAKFESMKETSNQLSHSASRTKVKVNRFVEVMEQIDNCAVCEKRVYMLEKIECNNKAYHKQCFRCLQCKCILRMDSYTLNHGMLYCIPHFKQSFITKGNYESGFGLDEHKNKWQEHQAKQTQNGVALASVQ